MTIRYSVVISHYTEHLPKISRRVESPPFGCWQALGATVFVGYPYISDCGKDCNPIHENNLGPYLPQWLSSLVLWYEMNHLPWYGMEYLPWYGMEYMLWYGTSAIALNTYHINFHSQTNVSMVLNSVIVTLHFCVQGKKPHLLCKRQRLPWRQQGEGLYMHLMRE